MQNKNKTSLKDQPQGEPQLLDFHRDFANFHEGYVRSYISLADTKAGIIFALTSSIIAYLFSDAHFHKLLFMPTRSWSTGLAYISSSALLLAATFSAWVIAPRTLHTGEGLVFFGSVSRYRSDLAYVRAVRESSEAELTEARLRHCYNVSQVCWRKYRVLRSAIWSGAIGLLLLLGTLALADDAGRTNPLAAAAPS
jgi:hypothetical protein